MLQSLLNFWWSFFPSTGLRVYYRMWAFVQPHPPHIRSHFLQTAFNNCSLSEQVFLRSRGAVTGMGTDERRVILNASDYEELIAGLDSVLQNNVGTSAERAQAEAFMKRFQLAWENGEPLKGEGNGKQRTAQDAESAGRSGSPEDVSDRR